MITRRLTVDDVPAMQAIILAKDQCGDAANPAHEMPDYLRQQAADRVPVFMAQESFRYFGSFDEGGNLLFFAGFFMWMDGDGNLLKPNYGIRGHWATGKVKLDYTIDEKKIFSDAYINTINMSVKSFEQDGFTSFWVKRPANPKFGVIAVQKFCILSSYAMTEVFELAIGDTYPAGYDEKNKPVNASYMGIDGNPLTYPVKIVRYDKQ